METSDSAASTARSGRRRRTRCSCSVAWGSNPATPTRLPAVGRSWSAPSGTTAPSVRGPSRRRTPASAPCSSACSSTSTTSCRCGATDSSTSSSPSRRTTAGGTAILARPWVRSTPRSRRWRRSGSGGRTLRATPSTRRLSAATSTCSPGELFRSRSTGELIKPEFTRFSFPPRWYYDVLRALDHLQEAGAPADQRAADAIDLVREKRRKDGRLPLQNRHPGETYFGMEEPGGPSRWNTLRALRVLRWWDGSAGG